MKTSEREIPKEVEPPELSSQAIYEIGNLCWNPTPFVPGNYDAVIVFGTSSRLNREVIAMEFPTIRQLFQPKIVYLTGGMAQSREVESEEMYSLLGRGAPYPDTTFRVECRSTNTAENVKNAVILGLGRYPKILFVTKGPHCMRSLLTLMWHVPGATFRQWGYDPRFAEDQPPIRQNNWFCFPQVVRLVWGEFLRIERYGERDDIAYPPEVQQRVQLIRMLTNTQIQ